MSYADQDMFFAQAYRTGTDRWTNIPFTRRAHDLALALPKGAIVLDIGAGRGRLMRELRELGFRVIGLENNPDLVAKGNEEIKNQGTGEDLRFLEGDALQMPLADASFDAAVDIGLMQHLRPEHFREYASEVARILKPGGFFFVALLSKETKSFFRWNPKLGESDYELEGVHYHFFTEGEIRSIFEPFFQVPDIAIDSPFGDSDTIYAVALCKKK